MAEIWRAEFYSANPKLNKLNLDEMSNAVPEDDLQGCVASDLQQPTFITNLQGTAGCTRYSDDRNWAGDAIAGGNIKWYKLMPILDDPSKEDDILSTTFLSSVNGCSHPSGGIHGGHVRIKQKKQTDWFSILPLCPYHNNSPLFELHNESWGEMRQGAKPVYRRWHGREVPKQNVRGINNSYW